MIPSSLMRVTAAAMARSVATAAKGVLKLVARAARAPPDEDVFAFIPWRSFCGIFEVGEEPRHHRLDGGGVLHPTDIWTRRRWAHVQSVIGWRHDHAPEREAARREAERLLGDQLKTGSGR
jgi:hypothetical protein